MASTSLIIAALIHSSPKMETAEPSLNESMDNPTGVQPCNGILLSQQRKVLIQATCPKPRRGPISQTRCWVKAARLQTIHTIRLHLEVQGQLQLIYGKGSQNSGCQQGTVLTGSKSKRTVLGDGNSLYPDPGAVTWVSVCGKMHPEVPLIWVQINVCNPCVSYI